MTRQEARPDDERSDDDRVAALLHRQLALVAWTAAALTVTVVVVAASLRVAPGGSAAAVLTARYAQVAGAPRPGRVPAGLSPVLWSLIAGLAVTTAVLVALVRHLARLAAFAFRSEVR